MMLRTLRGGMSDLWLVRVMKGVNVVPSNEHRPCHVPNHTKPSPSFCAQYTVLLGSPLSLV